MKDKNLEDKVKEKMTLRDRILCGMSSLLAFGISGGSGYCVYHSFETLAKKIPLSEWDPIAHYYGRILLFNPPIGTGIGLLLPLVFACLGLEILGKTIFNDPDPYISFLGEEDDDPYYTRSY